MRGGQGEFLVKSEQQIFEELTTLCQSKGYLHVVAFFSFRDNLVGYEDELKGSDYAKLFSWDRLIRTEISTLIGLMAQKPIDISIPAPEVFREMASRSEILLKELHEAMTEPFKQIFKAALEDPKRENPFANAEALREPIFYGAESAYSFQYRDFAPQKYSRDEEWLQNNKGFSADEGRKVVLAILNHLNEKALTVLQGLKTLAPEAWTVLPAFEFSSNDLVDGAGLDLEKVSKILDAFSFPNDGNPTFTSLNEFNSTNAYPLLKIDDSRYINIQYVALTEALYDTPFYWMGGDNAYKAEAMANRGIFTEEFSAKRLERVFGADKIYRNVDIWESKGKKSGEIDVLVLYADRAIVVQAKSKKLTLVARKGNDLQLKNDFKSAVQDACNQAMACSSLIATGAIFTDSTGNQIELPKTINKIHPICVVSDHYPALSFQAQQFLKFASTERIERPLVCDVFWLDVVTEMLDSPLRLLSYLQLRVMAGDNVLMSHEVVALGYHLKKNLWLGDYNLIHLHDDFSADLDVAMAVRREGVAGERTPRGILTQLKNLRIGKIVAEIERRSEPALIGLGLELLQLSEGAARDISEAIDKIAEITAKDGREHDVTVALGKEKSGLTIHCNSLPDDVAYKKLRAHCELRKYSTKAQTWHGVVVRAGDVALRLGLMLDYPWKKDDGLEKKLEGMPKPISAKKLPEAIRKLQPRKKRGRNEPCPCGSGLKYKKCCLRR